MSKTTERCERFLMFTTLISINFSSIFVCILPIKLEFAVQLSFILLLTLFLTLLNAIFCLWYRGFVEQADFKNLTLDETAQNCSICCQFKPERAHHCSTCKKCIKKMDHHCHWLGRCINYDNHGYFVRFLFFMFLNSSLLFSINSNLTYQILFNNICDPNSWQSFTIILTSLISALLICISGIHLYKQIVLIIKNITYIESLHCQHFGFLESDSPYNISLKHNFEDTLGPSKYLFMSHPRGNGLIFKKKYDVNYWPRHFRFSEKMYVEDL